MTRTGIITYDFFPHIGGIGRHTRLLYDRLPDPELLFFSPAPAEMPRHVRIVSAPVRLLKQAGVSLWLHRHARRIIAAHRLEQLNIHTGPGGVLCVRRLPVPVVVTCHHTYRQQCRHLPGQFWKLLFIPFEARTYRLADRIIAVSEATRDALVEQYGIPAGRITVIPNAVDPERFHPLPAPRERHTLLYLGRLDRRKGIDFLLRALPALLRQLPDARLLVGGTGAWSRPMERLARRLGVAHAVTFLGFVPEAQLNDLYNRAQCLVVPSVFEGFGITAIEALAAGTRVVGTDTDGIREILAGGDNGRLVPYGDTAALADAVAAELRQPRPAPPLAADYRPERFAARYRQVLER